MLVQVPVMLTSIAQGRDVRFWLAVLGGTALTLASLHRALSQQACLRVVDAIYARSRDRAKDTSRIRNVRIAVVSTCIFGVLFLWRHLAL
jgi:hypothetical protein